MGLINEYLKKIKEAIYGEEVRNSIHDAIEQCYKDATGHPESVAATVKEIGEVSANLSKETADRKAEVGIERKRIDNLVKDTTDNVVEYKADNFLMSCKSDAQASTAETTLNVFKNISSKSENLGNFITISSDSKIQIKKSGLYSFDCKVQVTGANASTGRQYARLKINDVQKNEYMISLVGETDEEFTNFIVSLNEGDTISFTGEADFDDTWITLYTTIHILDYDGKVKIPDITKEVSDIRVGENGTVYGTAGEAIRKQIGNLTEDIDNFPFQLIKSKNEFNSESVDNQDGKTLSDVGKVIDDSNYSVSHKIKCQYGDTVYLSRRISDISDERQFVTVWNICAYDSSDKFLGISTKGSYAVPPNTDYVRFNYWTTLAKTRKIMLSLNSDITYEEYFSPYHIVEKSAIDNPVKELFKDDGIIVDRKIIMPLYGLYVMQGKSVPVFFDNIIMHGQAKNLNVFQSAKGNFLDNGVFQKSLETLEKGFYQNYVIVNSSYNTLLKKNDDVVNNSRLIVVDTNAGNGVTRKVLVIGDSITAANVWTDKLVDLFSDDVMNVEMLGTRGTSKAPNEGRGGWRAWNYAFEKDASNDGLSSSVTNPFLNPTSNKFDFSYYMNQQNYTSVDYILLCLGTNDVSRRTHNTDDDILLAWKTIIDSIKAFDDNIKILIWLLPMPCGLTNEQPKKDTFLHMKELLINKYDNMESRQTNKIYLVDVGCSVSPTDDFNYKEELISEYGEEKWKRPTDIIHPATKGYYAIAKNIHAGIKAIESGVITN